MPGPKRSGLTRRNFARVAATTAILPLLPDWVPAGEEKADPSAPPAGAGGAKKEAPSPEALALAGIVKLRYGSRLDAAATEEVTRGIDGTLKTAEALRKVPLVNADEPAFVFRAWRKSGD